MFFAVFSTDPSHVIEVTSRWSRAGEVEPMAVICEDDNFAVRVVEDGATAWSEGFDALACGSCRLDDAAEVLGERLHGRGRGHEVELVLNAYHESGAHILSQLLGEFAIVLWDRRTKEVLITRDPFGLAPLFVRKTDRTTFLLSDSPDALADGETLDPSFVAYFLATGRHAPGRTIWPGVQPIPPGSVITISARGLSERRNWSPPAASEHSSLRHAEAAEELRRLLLKAVLQYVASERSTWADLSGGIDSSSVVSIAAMCSLDNPDRALGGTITFVDGLGIDESHFVDEVVRQYGVRNHRFAEPWPWRDDGFPPPITAQPSRDFPFYARDRAVSRILADAGGTELLSGVGPDHYLPLGTAHIADLFWKGELRRGMEQLFTWTRGVNANLWHTLTREVVIPLSSPAIQRWYFSRETPTPPWLRAEFVRDHGFAEHGASRQVSTGGRGQRRETRFAHRFEELGTNLGSWRATPGCKVRHPLLYRPLVDFCLSLPNELRANVRKSKAVMRTAMRGILPEAIVNRTAKGSLITPRVCWALRHERDALCTMMKGSILADLGYIEPARVIAALDAYGAGRADKEQVQTLYYTLSLETWMSARARRIRQATN